MIKIDGYKVGGEFVACAVPVKAVKFDTSVSTEPAKSPVQPLHRAEFLPPSGPISLLPVELSIDLMSSATLPDDTLSLDFLFTSATKAATGSSDGIEFDSVAATEEARIMKKWYGPCAILLLAGLISQITGCASTSRTMAKWMGRDKAEEKVADLDEFSVSADKTVPSAKSTKPKSKSEVAEAAKSPKSSKTKTDDKTAIADARADRPKATPQGASDPKKSPAKTSTSKSSEVAGKSSPSKTATTKKSMPYDETEGSIFKPRTEIVDFSEGSGTSDDVSATVKQEPPIGSAKLSPGGQKPPSASATVAQGTHKLTPKAAPATADLVAMSAPKSAAATKLDHGNDFAVAQANANSGLPAWALEDTPIAADRPTINQTAATSLQPGLPVVKTANQTKPSSQPLLTTPQRPDYLALCPEAQGEVRQLVKALDTDDVETIKRTTHRLGRMQEHAAAAAPALQTLLHHEDEFVRVHAALALVRMQQPSSELSDTLITSLRSPDPGIRSFAAAVLAEMGPNSAEALPVLSAALNDEDGYVRLHVAEVLIRHQEWSRPALQALLDSLTHSDENVRWLATYSLAELAPQSEEAADALAMALRDPVSKVQIGAAYALGEIGSVAAKELQDLERCKLSPNAELKAAAEYAINQIQQKR